MLFAAKKLRRGEVVESGEDDVAPDGKGISVGEITPPEEQDDDEEAGEEDEEDDDDDEEGDEDDDEEQAAVNSRTHARAPTPHKPRTHTLTVDEQLHNALATIQALTKANKKRVSNHSGTDESTQQTNQ